MGLKVSFLIFNVISKDYIMFSKGDIVTWSYHAGTTTYTKEGVIRSFIPSMESITFSFPKGMKIKDYPSNTGKSPVDRCLVEDNQGKFYAPAVSVLMSKGYLTKKTVAVTVTVTEPDTKSDTVTEGDGDYSDHGGGSEPADYGVMGRRGGMYLAEEYDTLMYGDAFPGGNAYILVAKNSSNIRVFARPVHGGVKFMFHGDGVEEYAFLRKSNAHPAYTCSVTGLVVNSGFGHTFTPFISAEDCLFMVDSLKRNFEDLGFEVSTSHLADLIKPTIQISPQRVLYGICVGR